MGIKIRESSAYRRWLNRRNDKVAQRGYIRGTSTLFGGTSTFKGFPAGSAGKESACNAGDLGSISGLGRSPREGKGYSLQYSGPENSMECIAHGVTKSWTQLNNFHLYFHFHF